MSHKLNGTLPLAYAGAPIVENAPPVVFSPAFIALFTSLYHIIRSGQPK